MYEIAWAAGFFEGEGCFTLMRTTQQPSGRRYQYPRMELASTDLDSLERFQRAVGYGNITGPVQDRRKGTYKPKWKWHCVGFEPVQQMAILLWPGLGERRKARAAEVLTSRPVGRAN